MLVHRRDRPPSLFEPGKRPLVPSPRPWRRPASAGSGRAARARRRGLRTAPELLEGRLLLTYSLTSLGKVALPPWTNEVTQGVVAINSTGEVAATSYSGSISEAYLLDNNGRTTWLTPLSGDSSSGAMAINDLGEVAGYSLKSLQGGTGGSSMSTEAVLYDVQGQPTDLGNLGGNLGQATALNDSGQVVGYGTTSTASGAPDHAFLYNKRGPLIDLGTLGGSESVATGINDAGQIVGDSTTGTDSNSPTHAFLLSGSGPLSSRDDLGVPPGYADSYATAINTTGEVAGYATRTITLSDGNTETVTEPFLYNNGQWTDLGNLGGIDAAATGIDDSGAVVGYSTTNASPGLGLSSVHAFLYTASGGIQDLNNLIDAGSQWTLENATAINASGVIAGLGSGPDTGFYDGFLLYPPNTPNPTPTPTPTSPGPTPTPTPTSPGPTPTPTPTSPTSTPPPTPKPGGPSKGPFHTRTTLSARPRSLKLGRPVTVTATVRVLGRVRVIPTGSVGFLDGPTLLDEVPLGHGKATLTLSNLPVGRQAIRVQYAGAGDFLASESVVVIENVKAPRPKPKVTPSPSLPTSTPSYRVISRAEVPSRGAIPARRGVLTSASDLATEVALGLIEDDGRDPAPPLTEVGRLRSAAPTPSEESAPRRRAQP